MESFKTISVWQKSITTALEFRFSVIFFRLCWAQLPRYIEINNCVCIWNLIWISNAVITIVSLDNYQDKHSKSILLKNTVQFHLHSYGYEFNLYYQQRLVWYYNTYSSEYQPIRKKVIIPFPGHESHFVAIFYQDR